MAARMPTSTEIENVLGGSARAATQTGLSQLRDEERRGRLMRDAKVEEACTVQAQFVAVFSSAAAQSGQVVSQWIDFGKIHFTEAPAMTCGSVRLAQAGEAALDAEASNYNPSTHFTVPCSAMVLTYRTNDRGLYTGAKVVAFALDSVPDGYQARVCCVFVGPAIRMG